MERCFTVLFVFALVTAPLCAADSRPNVVLIFTDDQGYQDVGCFGSPNIKTPNLDRLAAEGTRFTSFYVASSVCSPSRAALMTGCYPPRVGVTKVLFPRDSVGLSPDETTVAEILKGKGYATAAIGKWHLGHLPRFLPTNHGFDSYFGVPYSNDMDRVERNANSVAGLDKAWGLREKANPWWNVPLMRNEKIIERPVDQTTITRRYTEEAVKFITTRRDGPFFLYFAHTMPHIPLFVSEEFYSEDPRKAYEATIREIDWSVGQVMEALDKGGMAENTLVIFTTDNGPWLSKKHHGGSALPLRDGKFSQYEGGQRVPCIMRWPGKIPARAECTEVASTIDLLPTLAKLAGAQLPTGRVIDGRDIYPLMVGQKDATSPHEAFYFYGGTTLKAVRSGTWKLFLSGGAGTRNTKNARARGKAGNQQPRLYDLSADLGEKANVAEAHPEVVKRMTDLANKFDEQLKKDRRPIGNID